MCDSFCWYNSTLNKSNFVGHVLLRVWKAFSAYQNLSDLCDTQISKKENKFACFDGLKAISVVWVVYGHSIVNEQRSAVMNKMDVASVSVLTIVMLIYVIHMEYLNSGVTTYGPSFRGRPSILRWIHFL